jgi:hypothetical protein
MRKIPSIFKPYFPHARGGLPGSMKNGFKGGESARHSGQAKRDPESRPRLSLKGNGCRIESGMTAKTDAQCGA